MNSCIEAIARKLKEASVTVLCLQKELIREVEMGPFKHTVDDGLDLRKVCHFSSVLLLCTTAIVSCSLSV